MTESPPAGRLRKLDPRRDLDEVANLVEDAFNLKNDPDGAPVVAQLRQLAEQYRRRPLGFAASMGQQGFVWEDGGKVVGNISLIPFHQGLHLYFLIANVSVVPDHRGQGIAKALTRHAIRVARQFGKREIWLQVRSENQTAIRMYEHLGFQFVHAITQWQKAASSLPDARLPFFIPAQIRFTRRDFSHWYFQQRCLQDTYPQATRWYQNVDLRDFNPWLVLNPFKWGSIVRQKHFSLTDRERLKAVLTWQQNETRTDFLWPALPLDTDEDFNGKILLQSFLNREWQGKRLLLEYPKDRMVTGFEGAGFTRLRDLNWMHLL